jgi:large subunit ribosomal protein L19
MKKLLIFPFVCDIMASTVRIVDDGALVIIRTVLCALCMNVRSIRRAKMEKIQAFVNEQLKTEVPQFGIGDGVKVYIRITEGEKQRIQLFEGTVIAKHGGGISETFTVRRVASGVGVEKTFPIHSPNVDKIVVFRQAKVRRAKLYYLRDRVGKAAKVKEKK